MFGDNETFDRIHCSMPKDGPGRGNGEAVVSKFRLSFLGGFDPVSGKVIDTTNPLYGCSLKDKILILVSTKASSRTSDVLATAKKKGDAPAAFINTEVDALAGLGRVVLAVPFVNGLEKEIFKGVFKGDLVNVGI